MSTLSSRCQDWVRAASRHTRVALVVAVLAVVAIVVVAKTQDGRAPKVSTGAGADTEVSSQAKRISRFAPTDSPDTLAPAIEALLN